MEANRVVSGKRVLDKVAIVTGGASGIGKSTVELLALEGAKVMIGDFNVDGAKEVAAEICAAGGTAEGMFLDACDPESIKALIEATAAKWGKIDILVNNVGGNKPNEDLDVLNITIKEWERSRKLNTDSVFYGCRYAIPYMIENGGGSIVNTVSMAAFNGDYMRTAYGVNKAATETLTRYIASQYGAQNIRCNAVAPGLIMTPAAENHMPAEMRDLFIKYNALPYNGAPDNIGYTILFLASDEARFLTGQTIKVEGGHFIGNPTAPESKQLEERWKAAAQNKNK